MTNQTKNNNQIQKFINDVETKNSLNTKKVKKNKTKTTNK